MRRPGAGDRGHARPVRAHPRFVKRYADLASEIGEAVGQYANEVRARAFPTEDQTYRPKA